jgi:D-serine deaminase-like pyridoxal phosphate-dependent protein
MKPPTYRGELPTPALVIELPALERNISAMAAWSKDRGIALRPHAKTHKSGEIGKRQIRAGAVGLCCAKLGEAEALATEGVDDILITSPVVSRNAITRLAMLNRKLRRLSVVVDHPVNVDDLARADEIGELNILIDIDTGTHRTGVTSPGAAVELARRILSTKGLRYTGVQFYCGSLQHIADVEQRRAALTERTGYLKSVVQALSDAGFPPRTVTGGGTGSFEIDAQLGVLNELQPGSYVFMDRQYQECSPLNLCFEQALSIDARVISTNTVGRVTLDAGIKAMATEAGPPTVLAGADLRSRYSFMGDEHGALLTPAGACAPVLGETVTLLPPHCDPTVNLYDDYAVCDGNRVVAFWPVSARGRSS